MPHDRSAVPKAVLPLEGPDDWESASQRHERPLLEGLITFGLSLLECLVHEDEEEESDKAQEATCGRSDKDQRPTSCGNTC